MRCVCAILSAAVAIAFGPALASTARAQPATASQPQRPATGIPDDARYACPMETHPGESDPARQGAYFSTDEGKCPWCGMALKPIDELAWAKARRAAGGADVAYTCPDHQHVFSKTPADCPRCGRRLEPFKVMYTCPDPQHAGVAATQPGKCPRCRWTLAAYRGIWLSSQMAERNVPPNPSPAEGAAYRCRVHPLAHSNRPGNCPICAADLARTQQHAAGRPAEPGIPAGSGFVCPMHPDQSSATRGSCPTCGMQLVPTEAVPRPAGTPAVIGTQVNYLTEHYLELQRRFASDSTKEVALHALGLVGAADEILRHADDPDARLPPEFGEAVRTLRAAALKTTGKDLDADRVTFVELSRAMRRVIEHVRPSRDRYPTLYLFHCPMTKGDWIQATGDLANPFYGFAMLKCGEQTGTR